LLQESTSAKGKGDQAECELGEIRLELPVKDISEGTTAAEEEKEGECLMLFRDLEGKRVSLKVNIDKEASMTPEGGAGQGVITENTNTGELRLRSLVNDKLNCVPKNYKVGEAARSGFFRSEEVTIKKVDIDLQQQMKPYIYEIKGADDYPGDEDAGDEVSQR
jgi:hypothetical protein